MDKRAAWYKNTAPTYAGIFLWFVFWQDAAKAAAPGGTLAQGVGWALVIFICLSKGLTGGTLPLAAVLTTDAVYAAFYDDDAARGFLHSHSYTGNPLACRAALATLDLFEREDALAANVERAQMIDALLAPLHAHPRVRHARRLGMIWAWDIADAPADFARRYARHALAHGLLLRPIGATLYAMPPYVLEQGSARHLADGALAALEATLAEAAPSPSGDERALP